MLFRTNQSHITYPVVATETEGAKNMEHYQIQK